MDNDQILLTGMVMVLAGGIWGFLLAWNYVNGMFSYYASAGLFGIGIVVCYLGLHT